jgi:hypothetical protein
MAEGLAGGATREKGEAGAASTLTCTAAVCLMSLVWQPGTDGSGVLSRHKLFPRVLCLAC